MRKINIAIDGPASSGKGTVARLVAKELGYLYIDTGVMYRLLTFLIIEKKIDINNDESIKNILINDFDYKVLNGSIYYKDKDVTKLIRSKEVNELVSIISGKDFVREIMIERQKDLAKKKGVVMDGRDITSVVLKDAEVKIYLDASFEKRVERRYNEEVKKNMNSSFDTVKEIIKNRDYNDILINKTLVKSEDSVVVDTTNTTIEEAVNKVLELAKEMISNG